MIQRYSDYPATTAYERRVALEQSNMTVTEYVTTYKEILSQIPDLPEQQYVGFFLNGLRPEIRERVRTFFPNNILTTMTLARIIEKEVSRGSKQRGRTNIGVLQAEIIQGQGIIPSVKAHCHNWPCLELPQELFLHSASKSKDSNHSVLQGGVSGNNNHRIGTKEGSNLRTSSRSLNPRDHIKGGGETYVLPRLH